MSETPNFPKIRFTQNGSGIFLHLRKQFGIFKSTNKGSYGSQKIQKSWKCEVSVSHIIKSNSIKPNWGIRILRSFLAIYLIIRRPLLARGTKVACLDLIVFLSISGHCYSAIRLCFYFFRGLKSVVDPPRQFKVSGSVISLKPASFSSLFSTQKKTEKPLSRPPKNNKHPLLNL